MKIRKTWAFAGLALLAGIVYAVAQTIVVPTVFTVNPALDLVQVIPRGAAVTAPVRASRSAQS